MLLAPEPFHVVGDEAGIIEAQAGESIDRFRERREVGKLVVASRGLCGPFRLSDTRSNRTSPVALLGRGSSPGPGLRRAALGWAFSR